MKTKSGNWPSQPLTKSLHNWRVSDLLEKLSPEWHAAEICVATSGDAMRVRRISFHENNDGRKVVICHSSHIVPNLTLP